MDISAPSTLGTGPGDPTRARELADDAGRLAAEARARAGIRLEEVADSRGAERASAVLGRIWGTPGTSFIDPALLVALAHAGNFVAIAHVGDDAVGAAVGFAGPPGRPFHSHVVGLLPAAVGRGAGRAVKLTQRAWCLERGFAAMTWTFDPLVRRNARFNLRTLGAEAVEYIPDFYGHMVDAVNEGQHSDRMLVRWDLTREPGGVAAPADLRDAHVAVADAGDGPTPYGRPGPDAHTAVVALPADVAALRRDAPTAASAWRLETRSALVDLLGSGWRLDGVSDDGHYVLRKDAAP